MNATTRANVVCHGIGTGTTFENWRVANGSLCSVWRDDTGTMTKSLLLASRVHTRDSSSSSSSSSSCCVAGK